MTTEEQALRNKEIRNAIGNFVFNRQWLNIPTYTRNMYIFGHGRGYTKKEVGFAIQQLKEKIGLYHSSRYGWKSREFKSETTKLNDMQEYLSL